MKEAAPLFHVEPAFEIEYPFRHCLHTLHVKTPFGVRDIPNSRWGFVLGWWSWKRLGDDENLIRAMKGREIGLDEIEVKDPVEESGTAFPNLGYA